MPIFEYICSQCEKIFEKYQMNAGDAKASCPHCGSEEAKRILSAFSSSLPGGSSDQRSAESGSSGNSGSCCTTSCG